MLEDLVGGEVGLAALARGLAGGLHERAVVAAVPAQPGDRDEDLGRVGHHPGSARRPRGRASRTRRRPRTAGPGRLRWPPAGRSPRRRRARRLAPRGPVPGGPAGVSTSGSLPIVSTVTSGGPGDSPAHAVERVLARRPRRRAPCPRPAARPCAPLRSSLLGHQILPPRSRLSAVTSTDRTIIVSISTPRATVTPSSHEEYERQGCQGQEGRGEHASRPT